MVGFPLVVCVIDGKMTGLAFHSDSVLFIVDNWKITGLTFHSVTFAFEEGRRLVLFAFDEGKLPGRLSTRFRLPSMKVK